MEADTYIKTMQSYPFTERDEEITASVEKILSDQIETNNSREVYKKIYHSIDLTTLNSTDNRESVWKFIEGVNAFDGANPEIDNVAAICLFPSFTPMAKEALTANVKIAVVAAGFPFSQTYAEIKVAETALAVADGADEIDVVINVGLFLGGDYEEMCEELTEIKSACRDATMKVILETGALVRADKIHNAAILALYSGADFLKTSTGKGYPGASPEAVYVICKAIRAYYLMTGRKVGIKVSGGVSTTEEALQYYTIVHEILGEEWCNNTLFRIGASRLADDLLRKLTAQ